MTAQKEVLKARLVNLLNVESYRAVRQISFSDRNYKEIAIQQEFDYKMRNIMQEWDRQEKVQYIMSNGSDNTCTKYTFNDLDYRDNEDLDFIITKIDNI